MVNRVVRACLITNPRSGRGGIDLSEPLEVLQAHGWDVSVRHKMHGGQATDLARQAVRNGYDVVVNCGGDGTLSEIIDGVMGSDVAVGSLPGGTANLWAHEVGISSRLRVAALQLASAERRRVDVGHVTINGRHGQYFMLMAGLGLDGAVISRVSKPLKNAIGPVAIGLAAVQALPKFRAVPAEVTLNDVKWEGRVSQIVVGNTRRYGSFTRMTPDAFIDDGQLDVCLITATDMMSAGRQFASLLLHQRPSPASAEYYRASSITVRTAAPMPLEIDGGSVSMKKMKPTKEGIVYAFTLVAQGITVLLPRTYANQLFQSAPQVDALPRRIYAMHEQTADAAHSDDHHNGQRNGRHKQGADSQAKAKKEHGRLMKVIAVGPATLTAASARSGRVSTVLLQSASRIERPDGAALTWEDAMPQITEGDLIRVKGKRDRERNTIAARRVLLLGSALVTPAGM
ncbi:MAG TPA: diacylglycerol kinase family protein [Ktedonobacterales bacterium]|jgi:YegS/Rv2252/BmrU family lipid kinase|nr:diacylglycerol kinase family protein [Ktedonobacterales bacterium]